MPKLKKSVRYKHKKTGNYIIPMHDVEINLIKFNEWEEEKNSNKVKQ